MILLFARYGKPRDFQSKPDLHYFKIDEYLNFYTLHRTKFVSDDWMVNMGYMETAVDEKDKWLDTCTCNHVGMCSWNWHTRKMIELYMYMILPLSLRWFYQTVGVLDLSTPITVETDVTCTDATKILSDNGIDQIPVVNSDGLVGTYNTYRHYYVQIQISIVMVSTTLQHIHVCT